MMQRVDDQPARQAPPRDRRLRAMAILITAALSAVGGYFAYDRYQQSHLAGEVRRSFADRRFDAARGPLRRWLREWPRSAEAQFYRAWLALVDEQPSEIIAAIEEATRLGLDESRLVPLTGLYEARSGKIGESERILRGAYDVRLEPQALVAKELAKIYLTTYRLNQAAEVIERWRTLAPEDPQPYLWANEIAARSDREPSVLIRNYRAALERDPNLAKARLGLADQLSKSGQFEEAEQEFVAYLKQNPDDAQALVGLGHNAFQNGDLEGATRDFEAALKVNPRQPEALKQLAQTDLRLGRFKSACRRFEALVQIEGYDHEIRYSYAQALKLAGDPEGARVQTELAKRLRTEHDEIVKLRSKIVKDPKDVDSRLQVARWMFEHGHADEGLNWTKEILRTDPNHAPTHRILAEYYQKHGEPGLANYHRTMARSGP